MVSGSMVSTANSGIRPTMERSFIGVEVPPTFKRS